MRPGPLLLVLAVALAIGTFVALSRPEPDPSLASKASIPTPSPGWLAIPGSPGPPAASSPLHPESEQWKPDDTPATVARRYAAAKDKRAFYDEAQKVGGGAHLMFARAAYMQCLSVNTEGMVGAEQRLGSWVARGESYAPRIEAFRQLVNGCGGFEMRKVTIAEAAALMQRIRAGEDLASLSQSLPWINQEDPARARKVVSQAIAAGDPYVLSNLSYFAAGVRSGMSEEWRKGPSQRAESKELREQEALMNLESSAWTWALCEFGYDCGPSSEAGLAICMYSAICGWHSIDEVADRVFNADPRSGLRARRDEILAALRARDAARLGF